MNLPTRKNFRDLTGKTFGRLTVLSFAGPAGKHNVSTWNCQCECGSVYAYYSLNLVKGYSTQCRECGRKAACAQTRTHGMRGTRTYTAWMWVHRSESYDPAWTQFEAFLVDMGTCPNGLTLQKKNPDLPYSKANCYWGKRQRKKRGKIILTFRGETMCVSRWAERIGISRERMRQRLTSMSVEEALTKPKGGKA